MQWSWANVDRTSEALHCCLIRGNCTVMRRGMDHAQDFLGKRMMHDTYTCRCRDGSLPGGLVHESSSRETKPKLSQWLHTYFRYVED